MRWLHFILIQCLLIAIVGAIVFIHKDRVALIKTPPASLAQWYKPENKRQVWLHNMFKLRREVQAVRLYANNEDSDHLQKWADQLSEHYLKIGEMIPEWQGKLDIKQIDELQEYVKSSRYQEVGHALDNLNKSCDSCHADYRAVAATMYRAADFSSIDAPGSSTSWKKHMKQLTQQVNQIKIASEDGMQKVALSALSDLNQGMNALGETCSNCHKKDKKNYPGNAINQTIASLKESLVSGTPKDQGRELGTLAVTACAQCHGIHRLAYDSRNLFVEKRDWGELIKH
jgi:cytochrome c556